MQNFTLHTPTKVLFGTGQIAQLTQEIPADARILITYGGGSIKQNGVLDQVHQALKGFDFLEFGGIEPNPTYETLMKAVELCRTEGINFLLAVGGGSVLDGTKFIAAAVNYPQDPWHILETTGRDITEALPMGSVLTLPATGSEANNGAVISRRSTGDKQHFFSPHVQPLFAVLDPVVTYTLPPRQVANGVVDAFVHTIEQYLTYPVDAKVQDRFAEGLLLTLIEEGPKALKDPENYNVRANIMWSATMALNGLIGAGVPQDWATHMLGHELTARHGLDHAQTLAVVLPALLVAKKQQKRAKLLQYAERVWGLREGSEDQRIDAAIEATRHFFESLGVATRLSAYKLDGSSIPDLIKKLEEHGMTKLGEHSDITLADSKRIYEAAV
ncbi:NADH-dependent alcohol dehydrogenase [Yersinia pestis]|uniref:Iron-containing alcohol dehydrogenase n=10 Tax=Yersinia pseudotuberculosis complex TaxID=1649845 RepID=A0AAX2I6S3_YERPE|nr:MULTISPECIES: alcohol dehydrogenase [Yersinia pseudotuberculosis complex]EDR30827.1 alcohol dehydrogenase, iron-containing [Yersinia pestis biovar Orientalis str. IP275]EFA47009.1 alcohol dehydrogenase, iron-containing [Yersinia pestis KIM D27]ERP77490.1 aldehyde oxidoreductase [Yersinia pestis S3]ERP77609.1 aldehyde oxidoreductase [Yersinia pestis 24H]CQD55365.1 putative iron-containing alcohol dehydrogenase [Yersinia intermedia]